MDVREKLVEIIQNSVGGCAKHWAEVIADGLISHGVTVQEWISVKDRLPKDGNKVIVYSYENGDFHTAELDGKLWHLDCGWLLDVDDFTHWMPLPKPPKGE